MTTIAWTIEATYAGVPLSITSLSTSLQRRVLVYVPVRGEQSETFDQGSQPAQYTVGATLTGTAEQISARLVELEDLANNGDVRVFTHPIRGDISCQLQSLTSSQENGQISVNITLTEVRNVRDVGQNLENEDTTRHDVEVAAMAAEEALSASGDEPATPVMESVEPVLSWDESTPQATQTVQGESVRDALAEIETELLARTDSASYRSLISVTRLRGLIEQYARTLQNRGTALSRVRIVDDIPLASLLLQLGIDPDTWVESVVSLNSLRRINRLRPGTEILLPRDPS